MTNIVMNFLRVSAMALARFLRNGPLHSRRVFGVKKWLFHRTIILPWATIAITAWIAAIGALCPKKILLGVRWLCSGHSMCPEITASRNRLAIAWLHLSTSPYIFLVSPDGTASFTWCTDHELYQKKNRCCCAGSSGDVHFSASQHQWRALQEPAGLNFKRGAGQGSQGWIGQIPSVSASRI